MSARQSNSGWAVKDAFFKYACPLLDVMPLRQPMGNSHVGLRDSSTRHRDSDCQPSISLSLSLTSLSVSLYLSNSPIVPLNLTTPLPHSLSPSLFFFPFYRRVHLFFFSHTSFTSHLSAMSPLSSPSQREKEPETFYYPATSSPLSSPGSCTGAQLWAQLFTGQVCHSEQR